MFKETKEPKKRLHLKTRDRIAEMIIKAGKRKGDPLPSYLELSAMMEVSLVTIQRAMDELVKEGIVKSRKSKGSFVAKNLAGSSNTLELVGLVFFCSKQLLFASDYLSDIFRGMMIECESAKADVRIFATKTHGLPDYDKMMEAGVDGLVLCNLTSDAYLSGISKLGLPAVVVDCCDSEVPLDYVAVDNESAAWNIAKHLVDQGHEKIIFIESFGFDSIVFKNPHEKQIAIQTSDDVERRDFFLSALRELGAAHQIETLPPLDKLGESMDDLIYDSLHAPGNKKTAIIASNADTAKSVAMTLKKRGVSVPQDVSIGAIVGAGSVSLEDQLMCHNTADFVEMGKASIRQLKDRLVKGRPLKGEICRSPIVFQKGTTIQKING